MMVVTPKIRGFICTTAHPVGCAVNVAEQIAYVEKKPPLAYHVPKRTLIIGASTGYGLASRIVCAFGGGASTLGVSFEKSSEGERTASAGWYNTVAFEKAAKAKALYATSINGDAFSDAVKAETIERIRRDWNGGVDYVIYSLASPRRTVPDRGEIFRSVLKPIGKTFDGKTVDIMTGNVSEVKIEPATAAEVDHTVAVMGGEDWAMWIEALQHAGVLAKGVRAIAYSYIGPAITAGIYREGTIGKAKEHLEQVAHELDHQLRKDLNGNAWISVNKGLVTQASSAIPVVPLYISLLYKIMKEKKIHEGCIEQMERLFSERLCVKGAVPVDSEHRIRLDDYELRDDVQTEVEKLWTQVSTENVEQLTDILGYRAEFQRLFGFGLAGVDYQQPVEIHV